MTVWIFQVNPKWFNIDEYLRTRKKIFWEINQTYLIGDISIGDTVFIWRADGGNPKSGGIVGKGTIISLPKEMEDDAPELWIEGPPETPKQCVQIELSEVRLKENEGMLKRGLLKNLNDLKDMYILRFYQRTNYKLEPHQAERIQQMWEERRISL